jgi:hypothetical protein
MQLVSLIGQLYMIYSFEGRIADELNLCAVLVYRGVPELTTNIQTDNFLPRGLAKVIRYSQSPHIIFGKSKCVLNDALSC